MLLCTIASVCGGHVPVAALGALHAFTPVMHTTGRAWRGPSGLVLMRLVDSSVCSTCRLPPTKVYCLCSSTWIVEKPQRKPRSQGTAQALQHGWPVALSPGSPHASLLELPPIFFLHTRFIPSCQKLGNRSDGSSSQCPAARVCAHPPLRPPPLSGGGVLPPSGSPSPLSLDPSRPLPSAWDLVPLSFSSPPSPTPSCCSFSSSLNSPPRSQALCPALPS